MESMVKFHKYNENIIDELLFNVKINFEKEEQEMNKISKIIISALCISSMLSTTTYAKEVSVGGKVQFNKFLKKS